MINATRILLAVFIASVSYFAFDPTPSFAHDPTWPPPSVYIPKSLESHKILEELIEINGVGEPVIAALCKIGVFSDSAVCDYIIATHLLD